MILGLYLGPSNERLFSLRILGLGLRGDLSHSVSYWQRPRFVHGRAQKSIFFNVQRGYVCLIRAFAPFLFVLE